MATYFVLISTKAGSEHEAYNDLKKIGEIKELHPLFGEYDLIAKLEGKSHKHLADVTRDEIKTVPGVDYIEILTGIKF